MIIARCCSSGSKLLACDFNTNSFVVVEYKSSEVQSHTDVDQLLLDKLCDTNLGRAPWPLPTCFLLGSY